mmetsp:Transcript_31454/g.97322  ORF Transcript_31454/g.97322 Transcript_31454/m.97322 type:complete len:270 (-) Transcript_31454:144-953(-)
MSVISVPRRACAAPRSPSAATRLKLRKIEFLPCAASQTPPTPTGLVYQCVAREEAYRDPRRGGGHDPVVTPPRSKSPQISRWVAATRATQPAYPSRQTAARAARPRVSGVARRSPAPNAAERPGPPSRQHASVRAPSRPWRAHRRRGSQAAVPPCGRRPPVAQPRGTGARPWGPRRRRAPGAAPRAAARRPRRTSRPRASTIGGTRVSEAEPRSRARCVEGSCARLARRRSRAARQSQRAPTNSSKNNKHRAPPSQSEVRSGQAARGGQ